MHAPQKANAAARLEAFCLAYHADPNGTKAAISAGYSEKAAAATASRLLTNDKVRQRLRELAAVSASEAVATAKERQEFLTSVMRGKTRATFVTRDGLETGPPDFPARLRAVELLAKMQGDFVRDDEDGPKANIVINMPQRAMTPEEIKEARRVAGH